jgi:hypothetical protein
LKLSVESVVTGSHRLDQSTDEQLHLVTPKGQLHTVRLTTSIVSGGSGKGQK